MSIQLALDVRLEDGATFDSFLQGSNALAVACLRDLAMGGGELQVLIWGPRGSGKSHLLQAVCRAAHSAGNPTAYVPLASVADLGAAVIEGMADRKVVCIDDLDAIAAVPDWERALFGLINEARGRSHHLLFSAGSAPAKLGIQLGDLQSRLRWGPVFRLEPLDDQQKQILLQKRAAARGFELPEESARYLITQYPRDTGQLLRLLDRIDSATLAAQRRATLPFIKSVLETG